MNLDGCLGERVKEVVENFRCHGFMMDLLDLDQVVEIGLLLLRLNQRSETSLFHVSEVFF